MRRTSPKGGPARSDSTCGVTPPRGKRRWNGIGACIDSRTYVLSCQAPYGARHRTVTSTGRAMALSLSLIGVASEVGLASAGRAARVSVNRGNRSGHPDRGSDGLASPVLSERMHVSIGELVGPIIGMAIVRGRDSLICGDLADARLALGNRRGRRAGSAHRLARGPRGGDLHEELEGYAEYRQQARCRSCQGFGDGRATVSYCASADRRCGSSACRTRSAVMGSVKSRAPTASATAFAIAAGGLTFANSPIALAS